LVYYKNSIVDIHIINIKNSLLLLGGPGCSSFSAGIMFEHSPVTVPLNPAGWCCEAQDEPLVYNRYAWTNATVMLYVEQPIGVGFSEATNDTPEPSSEDDVAADFDAFLQNFYKVFNGYEQPDSKYDPSLDMTKHKLNLVGERYVKKVCWVLFV
jgi:carboxypeptidase C (cathepsin A)